MCAKKPIRNFLASEILNVWNIYSTLWNFEPEALSFLYAALCEARSSWH